MLDVRLLDNRLLDFFVELFPPRPTDFPSGALDGQIIRLTA